MNVVSKLTLIVLALLLLLVPVYGFCEEGSSGTPSLIQILEQGKARLSSDKKSILDEKGNVIATQISPPVQDKKAIKTDSTTVNTSTTTVSGSTTTVSNAPICYTKCVKWGKQCFVDYQAHVVCIRVCDEEKIVCTK